MSKISTQRLDVYGEMALASVPRLLSSVDRNPLSPSYGCMHRAYWLDKTSDFSDAVRQFGAHALALAYRFRADTNPYFRAEKVKSATEAALDFWVSIQHRDGSFDEFYPFERGWVGPSAFTTYSSAEAVSILGAALSDRLSERVEAALLKAARFIAKGDHEGDHLANHHAMACLALHSANKVLRMEELTTAFEERLEAFKTYHVDGEGWSREYDGIDPGYLSATNSFLAKIQAELNRPDLEKILQESVDCLSYFLGADGAFGGVMGARNTLHLYPHGLELLANRMPLARRLADGARDSLAAGDLVSPEKMADRYFGYRVPEFFLTSEALTARADDIEEQKVLLPRDRASLRHYMPKAKTAFVRNESSYSMINLAKGGVIQTAGSEGRKAFRDCGFLGRMENGDIITTQWIGDGYRVQETALGWTVSGQFQKVPKARLFTPLKQILFRSVLVVCSPVPRLSHWLKAIIRRVLITGQSTTEIDFQREIRFQDDDSIVICDQLRSRANSAIEVLLYGDDFHVRYVPQSRYFQKSELDQETRFVPAEIMQRLNSGEVISLIRNIAADGKEVDEWLS